MSYASELVDRYVALWNEPDNQRLRQAISELFTDDAAHLTPTLEAHGHPGLERRVRSAFERFVGNGRYIFTPISNVDSHHGTVKFNWAMRPANGGDVVAVGFDFLLLDSDGRIRVDYQFIES